MLTEAKLATAASEILYHFGQARRFVEYAHNAQMQPGDNPRYKGFRMEAVTNHLALAAHHRREGAALRAALRAR